MDVPEMMKAQVFYEPEQMTLEEKAVPEIGPEQVLVKVHATGICGSDVAYYFGKRSVGTDSGKGPLVLGHELSGIVAKVGDIAAEKGGFAVGDPVVVNPVQSDVDSPWTQKGLSNVDLGTVVGVSSCLRGKWRELSCDCPKDCMWKNGVCLSGRVRQLAFGEDTFQSRLIGKRKL